MQHHWLKTIFILGIVITQNANAESGCSGINPFAAHTIEKQVTIGEIKSWLRTASDFNVGEHDIIRLCSSEAAIIANLEFEDRGRNFNYAVVLIQPNQRKATELDMGSYSITGLAGKDDPTIIKITTEDSGQGNFEGSLSLVQLQGATPILLHTQSYQDNSGRCGDGTACEFVSVEWAEDKDEDGPILVETITNSTGPDHENLTHIKQVNRYRYTYPEFNKIN